MASLKTRVASVPILLIVGENDWLVPPEDFSILKKNLPSSVQSVNVADYNHLDYMWATDSNPLVNQYVFNFIDSLKTVNA